MTWPSTQLGTLLGKLYQHDGKPVTPRFDGPFEMVLWEIVAYLAEDSRRGRAFQMLRESVGLTPEKILAAPVALLTGITQTGGPIASDERAQRLREAARIAMREFGGDLGEVLSMPPQKAKKMLMQFPMLGEPGAEKILMFQGAAPVLALESNGVRVLARVGFGEERKSYAATYKSIREATEGQLPDGSRPAHHGASAAEAARARFVLPDKAGVPCVSG
jgi:endonuclease-3